MKRFAQFFEDKRASWLLLLAAGALALSGDYAAQTVALGACYAIALLGVDLVIGYAGMITVGHAAVLGVGAYAAGSLTWRLGAPMPAGVAAGVAAGALAGWILSLPALRAQDKYVALATLVTGLAFGVLFIEAGPITNGSIGITLSKREAFGRVFGALDFAAIGIAGLALCMAIVNRMAGSSVGRAFEAMRDSEVAANCLGVSAARQKQLAFILSGVFGGLAGALFTYSQGYIAPNSFGFETSVTLLLAMMIGGKKTRSGALLGAGVVIYLPVALNSQEAFQWVSGLVALVVVALAARKAAKESSLGLLAPAVASLLMFAASFAVANMSDWRQIIYGLLILGVTYYLPNGLAGSLPKSIRAIDAKHGAAALARPPSHGCPALELKGVSMSFDGFLALEGVDLKVQPGEVCGIIGPNGAGKSTLMNVITGVYEPTAGSVSIHGASADRLGSASIAQLGVARTFQNLQTFHGLTAIECALVGLHKCQESNVAKIALGLGGAKEAAALARAQALLDFVGLGHRANVPAGDLSYGEQRYLEIARGLGTGAGLLLLDEPAAGLRGEDLQRLKDIVLAIAQSGVAVVVIEHHMDVIREVCGHALALNFGKPVAEGAPGEVLAHPGVREAYLGAPSNQGERHGG
jgi:ABC-type branched-subunit amino acid transport system ATPase component/ABC-type branched-subunit amino acid transport system permease subunit